MIDRQYSEMVVSEHRKIREALENCGWLEFIDLDDYKAGRAAYIYFAGDEYGHVKIGVAASIKRRFDSLKTMNAGGARLIVAFCPVGINWRAEGLERRLHKFHGEDRASGEWFYPSMDIVETMREIANCYVEHGDGAHEAASGYVEARTVVREMW